MGTDDVIYSVEEERAYNRGRQDAAREIFDKLEQRFNLNNLLGGILDFGLHFCELKKTFVPDTNVGHKTESEE